MEPAPVMEQQPIVMPPTEPKPKASYGGVVALIIIVALVVAGAFYLFKERANAPTESVQESATIEALGMQSDSSEPAAIEADLSATSPDDLDQELDQAFSELDAAIQ